MNITVQNVPKDFAKSLLELKSETAKEIDILADKISQQYPDFKRSGNFKPFEKGITNRLSLNYF